MPPHSSCSPEACRAAAVTRSHPLWLVFRGLALFMYTIQFPAKISLVKHAQETVCKAVPSAFNLKEADPKNDHAFGGSWGCTKFTKTFTHPYMSHHYQSCFASATTKHAFSLGFNVKTFSRGFQFQRNSIVLPRLSLLTWSSYFPTSSFFFCYTGRPRSPRLITTASSWWCNFHRWPSNRNRSDTELRGRVGSWHLPMNDSPLSPSQTHAWTRVSNAETVIPPTRTPRSRLIKSTIEDDGKHGRYTGLEANSDTRRRKRRQHLFKHRNTRVPADKREYHLPKDPLRPQCKSAVNCFDIIPKGSSQKRSS